MHHEKKNTEIPNIFKIKNHLQKTDISKKYDKLLCNFVFL